MTRGDFVGAALSAGLVLGLLFLIGHYGHPWFDGVPLVEVRR